MSDEVKTAAGTEEVEKSGKKRGSGRAPHIAVFLQYQEVDMDLDELVQRAKAEYSKEMSGPVTDLKVYVKPEERRAYYVINGKAEGRIDF